MNEARTLFPSLGAVVSPSFRDIALHWTIWDWGDPGSHLDFESFRGCNHCYAQPAAALLGALGLCRLPGAHLSHPIKFMITFFNQIVEILNRDDAFPKEPK